MGQSIHADSGVHALIMRGIAKMLRAFVAGFLLLIGAGPLRPAFAGQIASGRVVCSTVPTNPTLVSDYSQFWRDTKLVNSNTDYILIGDSSTSFSTQTTNGSARLVTPSGATPRELDLGVFGGKLYCVGSGNGNSSTNILDYWRFK